MNIEIVKYDDKICLKLSDKIIKNINIINNQRIKTKDNLLYFSDLWSILENIFTMSYIRITYLDNNIDVDPKLKEEFNILYEEFDKKYSTRNKDTIMQNIIDDIEFNNDTTKLQELIDAFSFMYDKKKKIFLLRDLKDAKEDIIINMKYFVTEEEIKEVEKDYDKAYQEKDVDKLRQILEDVQKRILEEWKKYPTNMKNFKNGDPFRFIGHSTNSLAMKGDFYSRYVSTSLFTGDLTDTYRAQFGFIFPPDNIVGARSRDMYTLNYAEEGDPLLSYTDLAMIDHPQRLVDECIEQKEKNIKENNDKPVYNEIIKDGFNPIGIFCFTNGLLSLDYNYVEAKKLAESTPDLDVTYINLLFYKKGSEKKKVEKQILTTLINNRNIKYPQFQISKLTDFELEQYSLFFSEYYKLIKSGNYSEEDILKIFDYNYNLIRSYYELNYNEFAIEEIKYILDYSYHYSLKNIFDDKMTIVKLERFTELKKVKNIEKVYEYYPGLEKLLSVIDQISLTNEDVEIINNSNIHSFESLYIYINNKILKQKEEERILFEQEKTNLENTIDTKKTLYDSLLEEYQTILDKEAIVEKAKKILSSDWRYSLIKSNYEDCLERRETLDIEKKELVTKYKQILSKIKELEEQRGYALSTSERDIELQTIESRLLELKERKQILSKHPILNRSKIKKLDKEIFYENGNKVSRMFSVDDEVNIKVNDIDNNLFRLKSDLDLVLTEIKYNKQSTKENEEKISELLDEVRKTFNCEYEEVPELLKKAQAYIDENEVPLIQKMELDRKLGELEFELKQLTEEYSKYEGAVK